MRDVHHRLVLTDRMKAHDFDRRFFSHLD
jgi:hypothetical protein